MRNVFCPHCGRKVRSDAPFCPHCGFKLNPVGNTYRNSFRNIGRKFSRNNYTYSHSRHKKEWLSIMGTVLVIIMIGCYLVYRHTIPSTLKNQTIKGSSNFMPMSSDGNNDKDEHSPEEYFDDESIFGEYTDTESDFFNEYDSDSEFSEADSSDASDQNNNSDSDSNNSDSDSDNGNSDSNNSDNDSDNENSDSNSNSDSNNNSGSNSGDSDNSEDSGDSGNSGTSDDSYHLHRHTPYFLDNLDARNIHNKLSYTIGTHTVVLHIQLGRLKATAHYNIKHVYRFNSHKVKLNVKGTNKYSKNTSFTFNRLSKSHYVVNAANGAHHSTQRFDGNGVSFSK